MAIKKDVLQIELTTTGDGRVKASLAGVSREMGQVDRTGQGMLRTLGGVKTLFAGLATGAVLAFTKGAVNSVAALQAQADKLTLSTDALQVYRYAAGQTNVEQEKLDTSLQRIIKNAGNAARGIGESAKVFDELGVSVTSSNGTMRGAQEIIDDVAHAIARMDSDTAQLSATVQLADSEGADLVRTFRAMASGTRDFEKEARELGIVIDSELIAKASDADATLSALETVLKAQVTAALVELAPLITEVGGAFLEAAKGVRAFFMAGKDADTFTAISDIDTQIKRAERSAIEAAERLGRALELQKVHASGGSLYDATSDGEFLGLILGNFDIDKAEDKLKRSTDRIGELAAQRQKLVEQLATADAGAQGGGLYNPGAGAASDAAAKAASARQRAIDSLVVSLQQEADTYGMSAGQIAQYNLAKLGASQATLAHAATLSDELAAAQAIAEVEEENKRLFEESAAATARQVAELEAYADALTRAHNPAQQTAEDLRKIEEAFDAGLISADTYFNAIDAAFDKMNKDADEGADKVNDAWKDLGLTFSSAFEDAIVEGGNLRDLLKGLEQDILRIVTRKLVTEPLGNAVAGFANNAFGSFFGAATGADFIVPGTGGLDRQFLPVSSGERVTVTPPGQAMPGGAGMPSVYINISTPDADSFRASGRQVADTVRTALAEAMA